MVITTDRLTLRRITLADAPMVMDVGNHPGFIRFIGDRGLRDIPSTEAYLVAAGLAQTDPRLGFWRVARRSDDAPVGMTTLLRRPFLDGPDLGYALRPTCEGQGYAREAAAALRDHALGEFKGAPLYALSDPDNTRSVALLEKLAFTFSREITTPNYPQSSLLFVYLGQPGASIRPANHGDASLPRSP